MSQRKARWRCSHAAFVVITPPASEVFSLADARAFLRTANDIVARDYLTRGQAVEVKTPRTAAAREYVAQSDHARGTGPHPSAGNPTAGTTGSTPGAPYSGKKRGPKPKNKQRRDAPVDDGFCVPGDGFECMDPFIANE